MSLESLANCLVIGPKAYIPGQGARHWLGSLVEGYGTRALVATGEFGFARVADDVRAALRQHDVEHVEARHTGPVSRSAVNALATEARETGANVVVTVGGGRMMDAGKSAAARVGLPCITVPTSPATCAAAAAAVVHYDNDGAFLESPMLTELELVTLVDREVLGAAPDRLLAAGIADALAKVYEVCFVTRSLAPSATVLAARSLCDALELLIQQDARTAVEARQDDPVRARMAEAVLLWPALIGGLAGEDAKTAAAHGVHNALTRYPGAKTSLHGELVAYGVLVQRALEGATEASLRETASFFAALGCPCDLEGLGCIAARDGGRSLARLVAAQPEITAAFPQLQLKELESVLRWADELAVAGKAGA